MNESTIQVNIGKNRRRQSVNFISKEEKQALYTSLKAKQLAANQMSQNPTPLSQIRSKSPSELSISGTNKTIFPTQHHSSGSVSEFHSKKHHSHKHSHSSNKYVLITRMFSLLDKQHQIIKLKEKGYYFRRWSSVAYDKVDTNENIENSQKRYLILYDEFELLRNQLNETRAYYTEKILTTKRRGLGRFIITFLSNRLQYLLRRNFDKWYYVSNWLKEKDNLKQSLLKLELGTKHIEREIEARKQIELDNSELRRSIFFTTFFYKWKVKSLQSSLHDEKKLNLKERKRIYEDLKKMRAYTQWSNIQENKLIDVASERGNKVTDIICNLSQKMKLLNSDNHI